VLDGRDGQDSLNGGSRADSITGGAGGDTLTGGADSDRFLYNAVSDSAVATGVDTITDLRNIDRVDLHLIDADSNVAGNQAFHLVSAFTGHARELVVTYHTTGVYAGFTTIEGDVDGDGTADLTILATDDHHTFANFVL
jgi:hypothetical protein